MPEVWSILSILAKAGLYLTSLTAAGSWLAALVFQLGPNRKQATLFSVLGIAIAALGFLLKTIALTGDISGMFDPVMLGLLWSTQNGTVLAYQLLGFGLLLLSAVLTRLDWIGAVGAALLLWSFASVGHVLQSGTGLLRIVLVLHLAGLALWIGILTPLRDLSAQPSRLTEAAALGRRFGTVAAWVVPLLLIAGLVLAYALLGSLTALWGTGYGQTLLIKLACVAGLLTLAALNKLRFVPGMERQDTRATRHLRISITVEWLAFIAIFAATAVMTTSLTLPS